ncbi:MAG: hypothetical protein ACK4TN_06590, partial [Brevinematales bacterium]
RNDAYSYYLYQISFPNISYTLPTLYLVEETSWKTYWVKTNSRVVPGGDISSEGQMGKVIITNEERTGVDRGESPSVSSDASLVSMESNAITQEVYTTNSFEWWNVSSVLNGNLGYNSSETLDTNAMPISDQYHHQENVSLGLNVKLLNKMITWDHTLAVLNRKRWSSFEVNYTNNVLYSGAQVDYTMRTATGFRPNIGTHPLWKIQFPFSASHTFQYQLFRSIYQTMPREYSHTLNVSFGMNWLSNIVVYGLAYAYKTTYRITNGVEDDYLNNQIFEAMSLSTSLGVWWFSASVSLDTLNRRNSKIIWRYPEITNRISGSVVLESAFSPVAPWTFIPSLRYRYDLLKQTNLSLTMASFSTFSTWYPPFWYKVEMLTYRADLLIDYLSPRSSFFSLSFGT